MPDEFKYWAFVSYSHLDEEVATRLHKGIEQYAVPRALVGTLNRRGEKIPSFARPVFRDRDELAAASNLTATIKAALRQSLNLVVICTEHSAVSGWVAKEVEYFQQLGREDRIFCVIADARQRAAPESPSNASGVRFPAPLRKSHTAGNSSEPLAADIRPGKDGFRLGLLKTIAGILDVDFDQLRQRTRERERRMMTLRCALAVVVLFGLGSAYLGAVDAGLGLPGATRLRAKIDLQRWSVFRPTYDAGRINAAATFVRKELLAADEQHWRTEAGFPAGSDDRDRQSGVWASSQLACGVLHCPEASAAQVERALLAIEAAVHPSLSVRDERGLLGWLASKNESQPSFEPTAWTCAALIAALGRPDAVTGARRKSFESWLGVAQQAMDRYEFRPGCYSSFFDPPPDFAGSAYSTALALGTMLDCKEHGIPWQGSGERLDEKIRTSAQFLCAHFGATKKPPGWTLVIDSGWNASPGLTMQVLAELLRAHRLVGVQLPNGILSSAGDWVEFAVTASEIEDKDDFTQSFVTSQGQRAQAARTVGFLHQPWAIALASEWVGIAPTRSDAKRQLALADRAMSFQIVDRSAATLQTGKRLPFYFSAEYFWTTTRRVASSHLPQEHPR